MLLCTNLRLTSNWSFQLCIHWHKKDCYLLISHHTTEFPQPSSVTLPSALWLKQRVSFPTVIVSNKSSHLQDSLRTKKPKSWDESMLRECLLLALQIAHPCCVSNLESNHHTGVNSTEYGTTWHNYTVLPLTKFEAKNPDSHMALPDGVELRQEPCAHV